MSNDTYRRPKTLIVCCDGTWQNSDNGWEPDGLLHLGPGHPAVPTNITRLSRAVPPEDDSGHPQIVYYQAGIGTGWSIFDQLWGGGTGKGLGENIREAYAFLVNNYMEGDKIILTGFSRGAFTARSIAGLISDFGLLNKKGGCMEYFYYVFEDWEHTGKPRYKPLIKKKIPDFNLQHYSPVDTKNYLKAYKEELLRLRISRDVNIEAVGVFDTVGALGIPIHPFITKHFHRLPTFARFSYHFYDTGLSSHVKNAFQALALDEHRAAFDPAVWEKPPGNTTNLEQVWFSGVHSNIGGGYKDASTADISLAWMMEKLRPFVTFDEDYLSQQIAKTKGYYGTQPRRDSHTRQSLAGKMWHWGMGILYNSAAFPKNLTGTHYWRTPGLYHRTEYKTGQPTKELLSATCEMIHPSVRARKEFAGKDWTGKRAYKPRALEDWRLDGDKWVYHGKDPNGYKSRNKNNPKFLEESTLQGYELQLLEEDKRMAADVLSIVHVAGTAMN